MSDAPERVILRIHPATEGPLRPNNRQPKMHVVINAYADDVEYVRADLYEVLREQLRRIAVEAGAGLCCFRPENKHASLEDILKLTGLDVLGDPRQEICDE